MKNQKRIGELKIPLLDTFLKKRGFINSKIIKSWHEIAGELNQWSTPLKITFPKNRNDEGYGNYLEEIIYSGSELNYCKGSITRTPWPTISPFSKIVIASFVSSIVKRILVIKLVCK